MPDNGITYGPHSLCRRPQTYFYITLKYRLRPSRKISVRGANYLKYYYFNLHGILARGFEYFNVIYRYVWGLLQRLWGPYVIPLSGIIVHIDAVYKGYPNANKQFLIIFFSSEYLGGFDLNVETYYLSIPIGAWDWSRWTHFPSLHSDGPAFLPFSSEQRTPSGLKVQNSS